MLIKPHEGSVRVETQGGHEPGGKLMLLRVQVSLPVLRGACAKAAVPSLLLSVIPKDAMAELYPQVSALPRTRHAATNDRPTNVPPLPHVHEGIGRGRARGHSMYDLSVRPTPKTGKGATHQSVCPKRLPACHVDQEDNTIRLSSLKVNAIRAQRANIMGVALECRRSVKDFHLICAKNVKDKVGNIMVSYRKLLCECRKDGRGNETTTVRAKTSTTGAHRHAITSRYSWDSMCCMCAISLCA